MEVPMFGYNISYEKQFEEQQAMANFQPKILSANLVHSQGLEAAKNKEIELARIDGANNVVLVDQKMNDDAVVTRLAVQDIGKFSLGEEADLGVAKGQVVFLDDAIDDGTVLQERASEAAPPEPDAPPLTAEAKEAARIAQDPLRNLSQEDAFKFTQSLAHVRSHRHTDGTVKFYIKDEDKPPSWHLHNLAAVPHRDLTPTEKREAIERFQSELRDEQKEGEETVKPDGVWGSKTFKAAKEDMFYSGDDPNPVTDKQYRAIINKFIDFYEHKVTPVQMMDYCNKLKPGIDAYGFGS